jgi:hypothetical protein
MMEQQKPRILFLLVKEPGGYLFELEASWTPNSFKCGKETSYLKITIQE